MSYAEKIARLSSGQGSRADFIIADAKDCDLTGGLTATGPRRDKTGRIVGRRTREEHLAEIAKIVTSGAADIMLTSAGNMHRLKRDGVFDGSEVQPAFRGNETTDVWGNIRGGTYAAQPCEPFRAADLHDAPANLCLYSLTFSNDAERDTRMLERYAAFRREAWDNGVKHFLEVFNPNLADAVSEADVPAFVTDSIIRTLASQSPSEAPVFLKVPFNGREEMEALAAHDPEIPTGILGGPGSTHRDTFELLQQASESGARLALFGRKINMAEDQVAFIRWMRRVATGEVDAEEAVKGYHGGLQEAGVTPDRALQDDLEITASLLQN